MASPGVIPSFGSTMNNSITLIQPLDCSVTDAPIPTGDSPESLAQQMLTVRMLMSGKEVGSIIGKKGDNVKRYREESGARINISDGSCPERIVTVTGTVEQIFLAFGMMCQKFEDDFTQSLAKTGEDVSCPPVTLRLLVPATQCGSIIGKGGCKIKDIRELTGASIQVASEVLPNSTERTVTISGTAKAIAKCIKQLCQIFIETPPKGATIPYRPKPALPPGVVLSPGPQIVSVPVSLAHDLTKPPPTSTTQLPAAAAGFSLFPVHAPLTAGPNPAAIGPALFPADPLQLMAGTSLSGLPFLSPFAHLRPPAALTSLTPISPVGQLHTSNQVREMIISNDLIGCIIGRGGNTINEIRTASGAQIKISNCEDGARERKITMIGSPEAIQTAQFLISSSIELHKQLLAFNVAMALNPVLPPGVPATPFNPAVAAAFLAGHPAGFVPPAPQLNPAAAHAAAFMRTVNPFENVLFDQAAPTSQPTGLLAPSFSTHYYAPAPPVPLHPFAHHALANVGVPVSVAPTSQSVQSDLTTKMKPTQMTLNGMKRSPNPKFAPY